LETILGIKLSDEEKKLIISAMKVALKKDNLEFFLTEEQRRLLSNLINDFSSLEASCNSQIKDGTKQLIKKNFQLENTKFMVML